MTTTIKVENIKEKVNRLIDAYSNVKSENEKLRVENERLRNTLESKEEPVGLSFSESEELKKKIDKLVVEVDKCVDLISR